MGWSIENKNGKYRFWSSITDSWLTEPLTRTEVIGFLNDHHIREAKVKVIEEWFKFPNGWSHKSERTRMQARDRTADDAFHKWFMNASQSDDYDEEINKLYEKILVEIAV